MSATGVAVPIAWAQSKKTSLALALNYIGRGWAPIPIAHCSKAPSLTDWPALRVTADQATEYFSGGPQNVGVVLGEPSAGLTDIDLDTPEAVALAPHFLPETCTFGRKSKLRSHWLFNCPGAKTAKFKDIDGTMLVEIRSTGAQTVFPGSTHVGGEAIEFDDDQDPAPIEVGELERVVRRLAAAALLARHWPADGGRNDAALALAGALLRGGWEDDEAEEFIEAVAEAASDEESSQRAACVRCTRQKLEENEPTTGMPRLRELVGETAAKRFSEWLNLGTEVPAWVEEMNSKYFVVNEAGKAQVYQSVFDDVLERKVLVRYEFEDLRKLYMSERVSLGAREDGKPMLKNKATAWLEHPQRRQYLGGVVFAPGANSLPSDKYNLWQGLSVEPKVGDWSLMRRHLLDVVCSGNAEHFEYLVGWLARAVQYPGKQGEVAVVLRGGRGTGKGTVGNALMRIFGQHAVYLTNSKHLTGNFNAHLRDAVFVFADEAFFAGDRAHESVIKGLITDPYLTIEGKYQNAVTARNVTHILMASNERWVVPAGEDERRFFVLEMSDRHKQDLEYFDALHAELENGGLPALLHDLLQHDLADFDVRAIPRTQALADQKLLSLRGVDAWLFNCLQNAAIGYSEWTDAGLTILKSSAYDAYKDASRQFREYAPLNNAQWAKAIHRALGECVRGQRPRKKEPTKPNEQVTGMSTRTRELVFGPLPDCRAAFGRYLNAQIEWDGEMDTE